MENVNILSLVIATLIPLVTGFLFYSKFLFGNKWATAFGLDPETTPRISIIYVLLIGIVLSAILAFFMLQFCNGEGQEGQFDTFKHGAAHGLILALFVIFPVVGLNGLFEQGAILNFKLRMMMFVNALYWAITLALMGGVVDAMNHF